ncbi:MAG: pentapeptide repeat-containing protein [Pseudanabaena sp.]
MGADLSRTDLNRAEFNNANLSKTIFTGANTDTTDFQDAILPDV